MKTTRTLRLLSLLGMLLLFAPFYDSCDDLLRKQSIDEQGNPVKETKSVTEKMYDAVVDEEAMNAIEITGLSLFMIQNATFEDCMYDIKKSLHTHDWYRDLGVVISFVFDFIALFSIVILILSFTKKIVVLRKVALANTILITITWLYVILLEHSFEHWHQIKWGYYAFILNSILLYYYAKKAIPLTTSS